MLGGLLLGTGAGVICNLFLPLVSPPEVMQRLHRVSSGGLSISPEGDQHLAEPLQSPQENVKGAKGPSLTP